jgi:uncharacterized protein (DUF58 family)
VKHRSGIWLGLAVLLLFIGLLLKQGPMILVATSLMLVEIITQFWEHFGLSKVTYKRRLSVSRVFFGEEVNLEVETSNRKPLPLPWIQINDEIPESLTILNSKVSPSGNPGRMEITHLFPLMWYEKVTRHYRIHCQQRGFYAFGPARISTGDLLGLAASATDYLEKDYLIVYPKIVSLENLGIPSAHLSGEVLTKKRIYEDPILTMGIRDYQSGDSLKRIHWKSSARTGHLQTKLFEPSTTMDMGIFFDVRTTVWPLFGTIPHLTELGIIATASMCYHAMQAGFRVGLYINEWRYEAKEAIRIPPSQHTEQLPRMLENLAKIDPTPNECIPMPTLILREGSNLPWGSTVVVISAAPTEGLVSSLQKIKRAGRMVALVVVGSGEVPHEKNGLNVYRIPDEISWQNVEQLSLKR